MEEVVIGLNVQPEKANQGVGTLRQQLKAAVLDAQAMADQFGETSEQAIKAAKNAANLKEQIADINDTINALSPEAKFTAVIGVAQGIAGGFAAAQGAMALFGAESENVQRALLKVQAAMAIAQGLNDIKGLSDGFKNLGIVLKSTAVYTKLAGAAQATYNFVVGASTTALKVFRAALISTGIGAIVVGIASLVAYWSDLVKWVDKNSAQIKKWGTNVLSYMFPVFGLVRLGWAAFQKLGERFEIVGKITDTVADSFSWLGSKIRELLEQVGVLDTKEEAAAEKRMEYSKTREEAIQREIDILKARGATEEEIAAKEVQLAREKFLAYDEYYKARLKANRTITDEEKKTYSDLSNALLIAKYNEQKVIDDANKKAKEERDKEAKKRADDAKKRAAEELKIVQDLQDAKIDNIRDEREREIAELNKNFNRKIELIKGNSKNETELRKQLEISRNLELVALQEKFNEEDRKKRAEEIQQGFQDQSALLEAQKIQAEIANQETQTVRREQAQLELQQQLLDDSLSYQQKQLAKAEYEQKINEIDQESKQKQIEEENRLRAAKTAIVQGSLSALNSLAELGISNSKKQEKAKKALALVQIGIDTAVALSSAIATANAPTPDNVASGGIAGIAKYITIAATILGNAAKAKSILSSGGSGGGATSGGGGGGGLNTSAPQTNVPRSGLGGLDQRNTPTPQAMEITVKANVVETDVTKTQRKISNIESNATF